MGKKDVMKQLKNMLDERERERMIHSSLEDLGPIIEDIEDDKVKEAFSVIRDILIMTNEED